VLIDPPWRQRPGASAAEQNNLILLRYHKYNHNAIFL
jgi:hypothetical protein